MVAIRVGLLAAASAAGLVLAPLASAEPPPVEAGSENAAATINDLQSAGYDVVTQFENGDPTVDLDQCNVTDINTIGSAGSEQQAYVTITCPSNPS